MTITNMGRTFPINKHKCQGSSSKPTAVHSNKTDLNWAYKSQWITTNKNKNLNKPKILSFSQIFQCREAYARWAFCDVSVRTWEVVEPLFYSQVFQLKEKDMISITIHEQLSTTTNASVYPNSQIGKSMGVWSHSFCEAGRGEPHTRASKLTEGLEPRVRRSTPPLALSGALRLWAMRPRVISGGLNWVLQLGKWWGWSDRL